jgi:MarR family
LASYDHLGPERGTCLRTAPSLEASNRFPETNCVTLRHVADWSFLTNHARVLLCIAHDPGVRLRDIAAILGITERRAHGIITDLAEAGYVVKQKDGRRNRYEIQASLPLPEPGTREPAVGEVLAVLLGNTDGLTGPPDPAPVGFHVGSAVAASEGPC